MALYGPEGRVWTFTERGPAHLMRSADALIVGETRFERSASGLTIDIEERTVWLGQTVRGHLRLQPSMPPLEGFALDPQGRHVWQPLIASGRIEAEFEKPRFRFAGRGYHDFNWGSEPLESGFERWTWTRAELPGGGAVVVYDPSPRRGPPRGLALRIDRQGVESLTLPRSVDLGATRWGIDRRIRTTGNTKVWLRRTLEDTPFYARSLLETEIGGAQVLAIHESLDLDRFQTRWVRGLLPFKIRRGWRT